MKRIVLALLIVAYLNVVCGEDSKDFHPCEDKPPMCMGCHTLGKCKETSDNKIISFEYEEDEQCGQRVCDQSLGICKRSGTCRYKAFECPAKNCGYEAIYPDPYFCLDYHGCENGEKYDYKCLNGKAFDPELLSCSLELNNPFCYDYLAHCEEKGQTITVGKYTFTCILGDGQLLYPEVTPTCESNSTTTTNPTESSTDKSQISTDTVSVSTDTSGFTTDTSEVSTGTIETSTNTTYLSSDASDFSTETSEFSTVSTDISTGSTDKSNDTSDASTDTSQSTTRITAISTGTYETSIDTTENSNYTSVITTETTEISTDTSEFSTDTSELSTETSEFTNDYSVTSSDTSEISTETSPYSTDASDSPTPDITTTRKPFQCTDQGIFEDLEDCTKYYLCVRDGDHFQMTHEQCRKGMYFDPVKKQCVPGTCLTTSTASIVTTTTETPSTHTEITTTTRKPFQCTDQGIFEDLEDCTKYYLCVRDGDHFQMTHGQCRKGMYFDPVKKQCVRGTCLTTSTASLVTTTTETPSTHTEITTTTRKPFRCKDQGIFEDLEDCTKYYICMRVGDHFQMTHKQCRKGMYYNAVKMQCVIGSCPTRYITPLSKNTG